MDRVFDLMEVNRTRQLDLVNSMNFEQLAKIPASHNNSILWNFAHIIVTQHLLSYNLCDIEMQIPINLVNKYRKGSQPTEENQTEEDLMYFKGASMDLYKATRRTYDAGRFENFKAYTTSFGVELKSIEDAILFNNIHEGIHLGYMMALRKLVL